MIFVRGLHVHPLHVDSLPGARGSARRLGTGTATPPGWRYAGEALLKFAPSVASWIGSLRFADAGRMYFNGHGSKHMTAFYRHEPLAPLHPSVVRVQQSKHELMTLKSEFGVSDSFLSAGALLRRG